MALTHAFTGSNPVVPAKWCVSEVGYRASLSRKRPRVRAPYAPPLCLCRIIVVRNIANVKAPERNRSRTPKGELLCGVQFAIL